MNIWEILENLSLEKTNLIVELCKILLRKNLTLYAVSKQAHIEKEYIMHAIILLEKHASCKMITKTTVLQELKYPKTWS